MKLPISMVIVAVLVIVALVVLVAFFVTTGGGAASKTQLERTFAQNCITICARNDRGSVNLAATYPEWQGACEQLYGIERGASAQCLDRCQCGKLAAPCEFLCGFKNTIADWQGFCGKITVNAVTSPTYGKCDCRC